MWLGVPNPDEPLWIQFEFDRAYKLHELWVWNYNIAFEAVAGFGVKKRDAGVLHRRPDLVKPR